MRAHWLDDERTIAPDELRAEGVHNEQLGTRDYQGALDALAARAGYVHRDEIALGPDTPGLDAICAKFVDEHLHTEDEVRFVLEGAGIFDVRSTDDRWMRVAVEPGDLIVVPKDRHHRFLLTDAKTIRCVRLFQDPSGWAPHYR